MARGQADTIKLLLSKAMLLTMIVMDVVLPGGNKGHGDGYGRGDGDCDAMVALTWQRSHYHSHYAIVAVTPTSPRHYLFLP